MNVLVSKGVSIADDCIVGANSVILKSITENHCIVAGTPGKIIRRGVTWNKGRKDRFSDDELYGWENYNPAT